MTREALLNNISPPPGQVHRLEGERPDLDAAAHDYQSAVAHSFGVAEDMPPPAFDLVLLGMGTDAHTASLFPNTLALNETNKWFVANDVPQLNTRRLTATYRLLNAARAVVFLVAGTDKAAPLGRVLASAGDVITAPSRGISPFGTLTWVIDRAAAAGIPTDCSLGISTHAG
jgi:6-phosphogluconolactonase